MPASGKKISIRVDRLLGLRLLLKLPKKAIAFFLGTSPISRYFHTFQRNSLYNVPLRYVTKIANGEKGKRQLTNMIRARTIVVARFLLLRTRSSLSPVVALAITLLRSIVCRCYSRGISFERFLKLLRSKGTEVNPRDSSDFASIPLLRGGSKFSGPIEISHRTSRFRPTDVRYLWTG